jgi:hypothetical protein
MDPAIFGNINMPDAHAEEAAYDSAAWFNEREMETAESLYNSMINHTSPPPEPLSSVPEPRANEMVAQSIETTVLAGYANPERNLTLEAMATAADALLDPALLEEPTQEKNIAPSPNFEVVQGKVVPWGSVSSSDDQEPVMNGWHTAKTEDQPSDMQTVLQAAAADGHQQEYEDHNIYHEANDQLLVEVEEPQPISQHIIEDMDIDPQLQQHDFLVAHETSAQDEQMDNIDPSLEEAYANFSRHRLEQPMTESIQPTQQPVEIVKELEIEHAPEAASIDVQPPATLILERPASPVLANGIISPITPRAISLELDIPAITTPENNAVLTSTESANSKRQSAPQSKPVDRFTVDVEKTKSTPITNGASKSTSPQSVRKAARSKTPAKTPIKTKGIKPEVSQEPLAAESVPEADEDTMKLIEQMRQEDLGLRRRRAS